jgi:hypothetical protein
MYENSRIFWSVVFDYGTTDVRNRSRRARRGKMTALFYMALMVAVAWFTRASRVRIIGALAGGAAFGVVGLLGIALGENQGWWTHPEWDAEHFRRFRDLQRARLSDKRGGSIDALECAEWQSVFWLWR